MSVQYGHEDKWPANTWVELWVDTYNREPLLPSELVPWLTSYGLDALNPEEGLMGIFGVSQISYDPEQEVGHSMVLVRDPTGLMTKSRLLNALDMAPWTPTVAGPHLPSISYWVQLSDHVRDSQGTINAIWETQTTGSQFGTLIKVGVVGAVGVALFALYRWLAPAPRRSKGRVRR